MSRQTGDNLLLIKRSREASVAKLKQLRADWWSSLGQVGSFYISSKRPNPLLLERLNDRLSLESPSKVPEMGTCIMDRSTTQQWWSEN